MVVANVTSEPDSVTEPVTVTSALRRLVAATGTLKPLQLVFRDGHARKIVSSLPRSISASGCCAASCDIGTCVSFAASPLAPRSHPSAHGPVHTRRVAVAGDASGQRRATARCSWATRLAVRNDEMLAVLPCDSFVQPLTDGMLTDDDLARALLGAQSQPDGR